MAKHADGRIHWQKVLKVLRVRMGEVSLLDLSKELKIRANDAELSKTIDQLIEQGKITVAIGKTDSGTYGRVLTATQAFLEELIPKKFRSFEDLELRDRLLGFNLESFDE